MGSCCSTSTAELKKPNSNKVFNNSKSTDVRNTSLSNGLNEKKQEGDDELFPPSQSRFLAPGKFYEEGSRSPRQFTYAEIVACTHNFTTKVCGEGGFGKVYEGYLKKSKTSGKEYYLHVAVKRLNQSGVQSFNEWLSEVVFLRSCSHPNIVSLVGHCTHRDEGILVYEYMSNGSLDQHLFSKEKPVLTWKQRVSIAYDSAMGLNHLHCGTDRRIIFRDFKPSNILLAKNFSAKLSDFGLAKDAPMGDDTHVSTRVVGSNGYLAPEYINTGHLTFKSDVYAFGIVLLELISGRMSVDLSKPLKERSLLMWASPILELPTRFHEVVDPRIIDEVGRRSLVRMLDLVKKCTRESEKERPSMEEVVQDLSEVFILVNVP